MENEEIYGHYKVERQHWIYLLLSAYEESVGVIF